MDREKGALLAGTSILLVVALIQPFTLRPGHPWLLLVPQLIFTLLTPFCFTLINAIMPDICDLDELQSGQRREGLFAAVMGLLTKMGISLSTLAMGYLLLWFGLSGKSERRAYARDVAQAYLDSRAAQYFLQSWRVGLHFHVPNGRGRRGRGAASA